jgi:hypothetical protein
VHEQLGLKCDTCRQTRQRRQQQGRGRGTGRESGGCGRDVGIGVLCFAINVWKNTTIEG